MHHRDGSAVLGAHQVVKHADDRNAADTGGDQQQWSVVLRQRDIAEGNRDFEDILLEDIVIEEV